MESKECVLIKRVDLDKLKAEAESKKPDEVLVKYEFAYRYYSYNPEFEVKGNIDLNSNIYSQIRRICWYLKDTVDEKVREMKDAHKEKELLHQEKLLKFNDLPWYKKMFYKFDI